MPAIIAGVRIATVTTIGLVTVTALIGQGGLGQLLLDGFQRDFQTPLTVGIVLSLALAVVADLLLCSRSGWPRRGDAAGEGRTAGRRVMGFLGDVASTSSPTARHWQGDEGIPTLFLQHLQLTLVSVLVRRADRVADRRRRRPRAARRRRSRSTSPTSVARSPRSRCSSSRCGGSASASPRVCSRSCSRCPRSSRWSRSRCRRWSRTRTSGVASVDDEVPRVGAGHGHERPPDALRASSCRLAMPLIWPGIRTATVAVVATATLAAYVDSGGFGRYIVDGFAVQDNVKVFAGGLLVALLAIGLELTSRRAAARVQRDPDVASSRSGNSPTDPSDFRHRPGVTRRARRTNRPIHTFAGHRRSHELDRLTARHDPCQEARVTVGAALGRLLTRRRCYRRQRRCGQTKSLTVGSKDFSGAQAISQAYGQALEAKGYDITFKDNLGADRDRLPGARRTATSTRYADYQGTLLTYLGGTPTRRLGRRPTRRSGPSSRAPTSSRASRRPAVDVNGFYVTKATAKKYKLKTVSDLTKVAPASSTFGGPPECETRAALPRRHVASSSTA